VFARVDVTGPEIGYEQVVAAEHVKGQEAVMIIISVEEASLLTAMDAVIGGVEVEQEVLGVVAM
jgi:hypothetical protein